MRKRIFFGSLILSALLVGCSGGGGGSGSSTTTPKLEKSVIISDIFPSAPTVPIKGTVKLVPVVTNSYKEIMSSSKSNQIIVEWKSLNEKIATIDEYGEVIGVSAGKVMIEATAKIYASSTETYQDIIQIPITVINSVGNIAGQIAEIYLSPTRGTIDRIAGSRDFRLSAVGIGGEQTSLSLGDINFTMYNPQKNPEQIISQPTPLIGTEDKTKVTIGSANNRPGYVFIVPTYKDKDTNITTNGDPLVIQVQDTPDSIPDNEDSIAGKYLDIKVHEKDGKKELHIVHYDEFSKQLKYSYFNGTWKNENITPSKSNANSGIGAKIVLSPFINNANKPIIVALEDKNIELWYQNNSNNWINKRVSNADVVSSDLNITYISDNILDVAVDDVNKKIHIAYYSPVDNQINIASSSMSSTVDLDFKSSIKKISVPDGAYVESLSLALNRDKGLRIAYIIKSEDGVIDSNTGVFYSSFAPDLATERVSGTSGVEKGVKLKLDSTNTPALIYYTTLSNSSDEIIYRVRQSEPGGYIWSSSTIKDKNFQQTYRGITNLDFEFDYYNSPRISFNTNIITEDLVNSEIKYARRVESNNNEWIVETPEELPRVDGVVAENINYGTFNALELDSENRVHLVYSTSDSTEEAQEYWFKYWSEPIFFDYRRYELEKSTIPNIDIVTISR